jgi:mono/diheme cytochrome c family protein
MKLSKTKKFIQTIVAVSCILFAIQCGGDDEGNGSQAPSDPMKNKGIGPITSVTIGDTIDAKMAKEGEQVFENKCSACHKFDERVVGPALKGITTRRTPEWIMNMIINPQEMTQKDPIANELLAEYLTQMVFQNVTEEETRSLVEYFRKIDSN